MPSVRGSIAWDQMPPGEDMRMTIMMMMMTIMITMMMIMMMVVRRIMMYSDDDKSIDHDDVVHHGTYVLQESHRPVVAPSTSSGISRYVSRKQSLVSCNPLLNTPTLY